MSGPPNHRLEVTAARHRLRRTRMAAVGQRLLNRRVGPTKPDSELPSDRSSALPLTVSLALASLPQEGHASDEPSPSLDEALHPCDPPRLGARTVAVALRDSFDEAGRCSYTLLTPHSQEWTLFA